MSERRAGNELSSAPGSARTVEPGSPDPSASAGRAAALELARLAERAREGSLGAFEELVRHFQTPLLRFLTIRVGNGHEAEELAQETFLRAWRKLDYYDPRYAFSTWLFTLAKRLSATRARERKLQGLPEFALDGLEDASEPALVAGARDEGQNLWRLAARVLNADQRSALWLRYVEELEMDEIARILKRRRVSVRVLLFRAREVLRGHLANEATPGEDLEAPDLNPWLERPLRLSSNTLGGRR